MKTENNSPANKTTSIDDTAAMFSKSNYTWMLIGILVIVLGMFLMAGGKSTDPNVFNANEVYSKVRITVAPILIILGLGIEVFALFKK